MADAIELMIEKQGVALSRAADVEERREAIEEKKFELETGARKIEASRAVK